MKDIDGLENAVHELNKYWPQIEEHFNNENEKYKQLLLQDYNNIGRILKCHLIIENYIDKYITYHNSIESLKDLKLSFYQKAQLLPNEKKSAAVVKPGIIQINKIRNKFGHNLNASIDKSELSAVYSLLKIARENDSFNNPIDAIEAFTTISCTWLLVTPPELEEVFQKAFSKIIVENINE